MKDYAIIATAYEGQIRIYASNTRNLVTEAVRIHETWPTATAAFGRFLTVSVMMGLMYKDEERITLQIKGDGPIGTMLVEANSKGEVKGDIFNNQVYIRHETKGKLDVGAAVGKGQLHVTKDLGLRSMFTSTSELQTGEIAEDFAHYFAVSEQTPTAVSLGVLVEQEKLVRSAGGFIVQVLPGASEETLQLLENTIYKIGPVSRWFDENKTIEELVSALANNTEKVLDQRDLSYKCHCSKEGFSGSLAALDKETMDELIEDDGIEVICHFCKTKYNFSKDELKEIQRVQLSK